MKIKVPARFYQDHCDRSETPQILISAILKTTGSYFIVELNGNQINYLLGDAEYYADGVDYPELHGVMKSAKATVKLINAQIKVGA